MPSDRLIVERSEQVLRLTINRPEKRNALSMALLDDIGAALSGNADEHDIKVAVITGAGEQCFAAGGDLRELDAVRSEDQAREMAERGRRALDQIRYFPLPVIGVLNGLALGGGAELAMACDLRIGSARAEIGFLQSRLNVTTAWGGGIDLLEAIGPGHALHLLVQGARIGMDEAQRLGLVERVCPLADPLEDFVSQFLATYTDKSPQVIRGYKAVTAARRNHIHEQFDELAQVHFITSWTHPDHWAAAAAALRK